jgi:selenocysteine-specific elongation factor
LAENPLSPQPIGEVLRAADADMPLVSALVDEGELVRVSDDLYYVAQEYSSIVDRILDMIKADGSISVAEMRDRFGTSRRYALAILEHLDSERITRRVGDVRVLGSKAPRCA